MDGSITLREIYFAVVVLLDWLYAVICEKPNTVCRIVNLNGGKWTTLVLWRLLEREHRYADLQRQIGGVSQKVLSAELKTLVQAGLVEREVNPTVPPQVTYRITPKGRSLDTVFTSLWRWGETHL